MKTLYEVRIEQLEKELEVLKSNKQNMERKVFSRLVRANMDRQEDMIDLLNEYELRMIGVETAKKVAI